MSYPGNGVTINISLGSFKVAREGPVQSDGRGILLIGAKWCSVFQAGILCTRQIYSDFIRCFASCLIKPVNLVCEELK